MTTAARVESSVAVAQPSRRLGKGALVWSWMTTTDHKVIAQAVLWTALASSPSAACWRSPSAPNWRSRVCSTSLRDVQPVLHHARHDHAADVRDADVRRLRQRHHAAADRRPRRRLPAAEHVQLLAVPVRLADRLCRLPEPDGAASFGWFAYVPLSDAINSPGVGGDLWIMGLYMLGLSSILGAVNFITTIITMRAPGHDHVPHADLHLEHPGHLDAVLIVFPVLAAGLLVLEPTASSAPWSSTPQRRRHPCGSTCSGSSATPRSTSSRCRSSASSPRSPGVQPQAGLRLQRPGVRHAVDRRLSISVWAHHMFVTGAVNLPFFSFMTFMIAVPTG
jgi:cytochrome c oxidase subunit 1